MIFAAGLGTRLRPLTNDRPKALVEVKGKTLLEHNILKLRDAGFDHLVVNVHHFGEQIISFLESHQNFGIDIRVSDERDLLLDTGGGLRRALSLFPNDDPVLIHNVDIVSEADVAQAYRDHLQSGADATLLVNERKTSRYLSFEPVGEHPSLRLRGWINISTGETKGEVRESFRQKAFSGIHIINQSALAHLKAFTDEPAFPIMDFYIRSCPSLDIRGSELPADCRWVDCGKVESLAKAAEILP